MEKINKIVELGIDLDNVEDEELFEELGVDVISLVENPAIEVDFLAFNEEQKQEFVEPRSGESEDEFIGRCMSALAGEFPDEEQRLAVCYGYWEGSCEECSKFDLEDACLPGYVAIGLKPKGGRMVPNCVPVETAQEFSFTDYPEAVKENAARGIRLNEELDNKCATQVGKVRAQQLANGEPVSLETVARMKSYLSRAAEFYNPDNPEACGTISYLLWGGEEALRWAERTLERENEEFYKKKKKKRKYEATDEELDKVIEMASELGFQLGPDDTVLDFSNNKFADSVSGVVDLIKGLDILERLNVKKGAAPETRYRYAGPPAQRKFCRAMLRLNRLYTRQEIQAMVDINKSFGHNGAPYSKWSWAGGPNCRHYWEEVAVFKGENNQRLTIVKGPAVGNAGQPNSQRADKGYYSQQFALNEEQRIAIGPIMIPNQMILRRDEDGNPYYVYFSRETIRKMLEKFLANNNHNNTDVDHDGNVHTENTLLETWISEDMAADKSAKYGFTLPVGTWFASYRVNSDEDWNAIKEGRLKGFSLAGNFLERLKPKQELTPDEELLERIKSILKDV